MHTEHLSRLLKKYWGYDSFRPYQLEAIRSVMQGRDTVVLMPTGGGKSLLYQLPAIAGEGICIVVTPLISLMKDQTDRLRRLGINAAAIHSGLTTRQIDIILDNCCWGDVKLLYVAPERIAGDTFRTRVRGMNVSLVAVDEAHCISQWGYDFRPAYLRIAQLRDIVPDAPVMALTATATELVAKDIERHLRMTDPLTVRSSYARPNLSLAVRHTDDKQGQMRRIIGNVPGQGIIYVRTRESTVRTAQWLNDSGITAEYYHGGLSAPDRARRQESWMSGRSRIMCATNAFGMGIDKADVRFIIHPDACDSLEAYYQEAGRAGRDGRRSYAVLLYSSDEKGLAIRRIEKEFPTIEKVRECYDALFNYLGIGIGDGKYASLAFDINDFSRKSHIYTDTAYNCIKILQQNGYMNLGSEEDNPPRIKFTVGRDELYRIRIEKEELDHIIRTVLRLYTGLFHDRFVPIATGEIAASSGYTEERVRELLKTLWQLRIISYIPGCRATILFLAEERLPARDVFISPETYEIRRQMTAARVEAMHSYAQQDGQCRSAILQRYFGEQDPDDCGCCDVCLSRKKKADGDPIVRQRVQELLDLRPRTVKDLVGEFTCSPAKILAVIDELIGQGLIGTAEDGKLHNNS